MFSKNKSAPQTSKPESKPAEKAKPVTSTPTPSSATSPAPVAPKAKPPASVLSADLTIKGNIKTSGDVQVQGTVEGDIRAHLLTIGEGATVKGEVIADDLVINGRIIGRVRGLKVRLTSTADVKGDIIHKTIAIESGAHFEGSVTRQDDPLSTATASKAATSKAKAPASS